MTTIVQVSSWCSGDAPSQYNVRRWTSEWSTRCCGKVYVAKWRIDQPETGALPQNVLIKFHDPRVGRINLNESDEDILKPSPLNLLLQSSLVVKE